MEAIIIPGLPNDIALQCLFRLPFSQIHCLRYVCKAWNSEIKPSELFRLRRSAAYKTQPLIILHPLYYNEEHRLLLVFDPETGLSSVMPRLPDSNKLPFDCRTAVVGSELIVMGGYEKETETETCLDSVFIFDFYSSTWRLGANMPDGPRMRFACATYNNRIVFVAGGLNTDDTFISAWTYDVASNKWNQLPDMIDDSDMERATYYTCTGAFYHDKFEVFVILPGQGNIKREIFNISTRQWSEADYSLSWTLWHRYVVEGCDQNNYIICNSNDLAEIKDNKWRNVAKLPINSSDARHIISSPGHIWFICRQGCEEPYDYFKMDLNDLKWVKGKFPIKFYGYIDIGYSLSI